MGNILPVVCSVQYCHFPCTPESEVTTMPVFCAAAYCMPAATSSSATVMVWPCTSVGVGERLTELSVGATMWNVTSVELSGTVVPPE